MRELRVALRSLRHSPGFTIAAIITLAVSIAANTSVFSVLNAVLLNPLSLRHIPDSKRVVVLYEKNPSLAAFIAERLTPRPKTIATWQHQAHAFSDVAYLRDTPVSVIVPGANHSERTSGGRVSPNFFAFFGVHTAVGRSLNASDLHRLSAVLTNSFAEKLFGSASAAIGHSIIVNGAGMRIAGVLGKDFELPSTWGGQNEYNPQVLSLYDEDLATTKDQSFNFTVFARMRPGYDRARAQSDLDAIAAHLRASEPDDYAGFSANVRNLLDETVDSDTQQAVVVLQVAVAFVLLIACANVGNLLLTRAVARDKEIAVRVAIGAGRGSIVRQIFAESCLLAVVAGAIGIALTFAVIRLIAGMLPDGQGFHEIRVDVPVLLFTVGASLLCAVLFALPAVWRSWGIRVNQTLNRSSRSVAGSSNRLRTMLSVGQVALSLILLVGAGLLLRSLRILLDTDLGFEHTHITSIRVSLPPASYPDAQLPALNRNLLSAVQQVPGVQSAALSTDLPMRGFQISSFEIPGRQNKPGEVPNSDWSRTTAGFFKAMGIQILAGRVYSEAEVSSDAPVVVINRKLALAYWPGQDPLGKTLKFADKTRQIIGIVANEHQAGPDTEQSPELYFPGFANRDLYAVARTAGNPTRYGTELAAVVKRLDPTLNPEVQTADESLHSWLAPRRFNMTVVSCFAAVAIVLAGIGLYSLLAYSITLRQREIGIRLAIGADPAAVTRMILRNALLIAGAGILIGLAAAFALTRFIENLIFGVSASDPVTYLAVTLLLAAISLLAGYVPARRAAKIDPLEALRQE